VDDRKATVLLAGPLGLALLLRLVGLGWGLPVLPADTAAALPELRTSYHLDEDQVLWPLTRVRPERLDFFVPDFHWGTLQLHLVEAALLLGQAAGLVPSPWREAFASADPVAFPRLFELGRAVSALLGAGAVLVGFRLGRRLHGPRAGLMAALLLAVLPLPVVFAHYLTVDVTLSFFVLLAVERLVAARQAPTLRAFALAGLACGLAISAKPSAVFLLPAALAAVIPLRKAGAAAVLAAAALLGFALGEPYAFAHPALFWRDAVLRHVHGLGLASAAAPSLPVLAGLQLRTAVFFGLGLPVTLAAVAGALAARSGSARVPGRAVLDTAWWAFALSVLPMRYPLARYLLPAIVLSTVPLGALLARLAQRPPGRVAVTLAVGLTVLLSGAQVELMTRAHPAEAARAWIEAAFPHGATVYRRWEELPILDPRRYASSASAADADVVVADDLTFLPPAEDVLRLRHRLAAEFGLRPRLVSWLEPRWSVPHDARYYRPTLRIWIRR
jgi:dolichyl-phosphate-mannose-protein mannosyltransferase